MGQVVSKEADSKVPKLKSDWKDGLGDLAGRIRTLSF